MPGYFEPLSDPDENAPAKLVPRAHPWAAAIDGAAPVPAAVRSQLGWGQSMIQSPEYAAANPPPYLTARNLSSNSF